ncbi:MAG: hypothetical protein JW904_12740 [Spirochaetales bacterium]|nr:hypothetical protein [Spirochaetales bacterium]
MATKEGFFDRFRPLPHIPMIIGGIALAVGLAFLFGFIVMWLWNWLMPDIFGLPTIGYWQAWGLVILAHILTKGGSGLFSNKGEGKGPIRKRIKREIKNEFRKEFKAEMRKAFDKELKKDDPDENAFRNWVMSDDEDDEKEDSPKNPGKEC